MTSFTAEKVYTTESREVVQEWIAWAERQEVSWSLHHGPHESPPFVAHLGEHRRECPKDQAVIECTKPGAA